MKFLNLFFFSIIALSFSCSNVDNSKLEQKLNEVTDGQKLLLKKIDSMDKAIANLALANKNKPADNKKQPPKADPNKVYNIPIGDSFTKGPSDAAVTIIEWTDFQ